VKEGGGDEVGEWEERREGGSVWREGNEGGRRVWYGWRQGGRERKVGSEGGRAMTNLKKTRRVQTAEVCPVSEAGHKDH